MTLIDELHFVQIIKNTWTTRQTKHDQHHVSMDWLDVSMDYLQFTPAYYTRASSRAGEADGGGSVTL